MICRLPWGILLLFMIWFNLEFAIFVSYRGMWYIAIKIVGTEYSQGYESKICKRWGHISIDNLVLKIIYSWHDDFSLHDKNKVQTIFLWCNLIEFNKKSPWIKSKESFRGSHQSCFLRKGVLGNFVKFTKSTCEIAAPDVFS